MNIKVLDVTLRDGGCVNNFNFGRPYMEKILSAQEAAGVDLIELGYIDQNKGSASERTQFCDEQVIPGAILQHKKPGTTYVAMMDYGKFDPNNLLPKMENNIDGIRVAFHKKDLDKVFTVFRQILDKGYQLYIQPMLTMRYSDSELLNLIANVNEQFPETTAFYIVDSFGEMRSSDLVRLLHLVDHNLASNISVGFHSHNNLQLSYSNAISMLDYKTSRTLILDSSIMGMGKGAGNLNTELLLEHLNLYYGKKYKVAPLLEVIDTVINQLHAEYKWGYAAEYYLSSIHHCTPSYAMYFYEKHMLPIDHVSALLESIDEEKKISFDREYAEILYRKFNERQAVDDELVITELKNKLQGKRVVLIAPGRSILEKKEELNTLCEQDDVVTVGLNLTEIFNPTYVLVTREEVYKAGLKSNQNMLVVSNVSKDGNARIKILNYKRWINKEGEDYDSSAIIALNLLRACGVDSILLYGFDGFSADINENYYDIQLRHPIDGTRANLRNNFYRTLFKNLKAQGIMIRYGTKSRYEQ